MRSTKPHIFWPTSKSVEQVDETTRASRKVRIEQDAIMQNILKRSDMIRGTK